MKVTLDEILFQDGGNYKDISVELSESAGPISPEYQYDLSIKLHIENGLPRLQYKKEYMVESDEKKNIVFHLSPDRNQYKSMMKDLLRSGNFSKSVNLIDSRHDRIGISFNFLTIVMEGKAFRLDYLLADKEKKEFEFSAALQIVEKWSALKQ